MNPNCCLKSRPTVFWIAMACVAITLSTVKRANAVVTEVFRENFDTIPLGPFVSPTEGGGDGTDFSITPPTGWTRDNTTTPIGNPIEFQGFTFLDKKSWTATAGNQERHVFTRGGGTVLVADVDEYDDGTNIDPAEFNAFIQTPVISLAGITPGSATLNYDASFRPFDTATASVDVSFDGGATFTNLKTQTGGSDNPNLPNVNENISLALNNNGVNNDLVVRFGMTRTGNDWWWALDNISVKGDDPTASPRVALYSEGFEDLGLGPFVSPTEGGGDGTDFTGTPPTGWTKDNTTTPIGNPVEFQGWTFLDKESWIATAGNQDRADFTFGIGTVAVADADEYDDGTDVGDSGFNVFMTTPGIDMNGIQANSMVLEFDSSFRPFDDMTGSVEMSFDGGATWEEVVTLLSAGHTAQGTADVLSRNEHLSYLINNPGQGIAMFRFGLTNAGNDWWWAIDNIEVTAAAAQSVPEPTTALLLALGSGLMLRRRRTMQRH